MKNTLYLLVLLQIILAFAIVPGVHADNSYEMNYSLPQSPPSQAMFVVRILKYDPYPVNAGDWFNLWVKVQNVGQADAPNAKFELIPEYPFSSNDTLTRDFGIIYGAINAYKVNQDSDASQVILKYHVKVEDNAQGGVSNIKFRATADGNNPNSAGIQYNLPIEIAQTKTDFDIKLHDTNPQESSFVVTNIGKNTAKAVTIDVKKDENIAVLRDAEPASLSDLGQGEFTIAHLKAVPKQTAKAITLEISYTDTSGVRSNVEKTVQLDELNMQNICVQPAAKSYLNWVYALIGFLTGAFLVIIGLLMRQKRHARHVKG